MDSLVKVCNLYMSSLFLHTKKVQVKSPNREYNRILLQYQQFSFEIMEKMSHRLFHPDPVSTKMETVVKFLEAPAAVQV